jgi:hypothetical protein
MRLRRFRPAIEGLDPRTLLSSISVIDLGIRGKVLNLQGTSYTDLILITPRAVRVNSEALAIPAGCVGIYADGNGGGDLILNLQEGVPVILHGGPGDDLIVTQPADGFIPNIVYGDEGDNVVLGDPTRSTIFPEAVGDWTLDVLGPVVFFYDASPTVNTVTVTTDPDGGTIVDDGVSETFLPASYRVGVFDLGAGDDVFLDASTAFRTIVYGGDGTDDMIGDEVHQD